MRLRGALLLRAILNTAIKEDEITRQNPCRIPGYDRYHTPDLPRRASRRGTARRRPVTRGSARRSDWTPIEHG
jgi:hypothetical protein